MRDLRIVYLLLAIVGAVIPLVFFLEHFTTAGFGLGTFVAALFANPAAAGFTTDLLISSAVFWLWMFSRSGPAPAPFIVLNLCIGLSCALPAYLYACARQSAATNDGLVKGHA